MKLYYYCPKCKESKTTQMNGFIFFIIFSFFTYNHNHYCPECSEALRRIELKKASEWKIKRNKILKEKKILK